MEIARIATLVLLFVSLVDVEMTRRCYEGVHGLSTTEKVCIGSCKTVKTEDAAVASCDHFTIGVGCMWTGNVSFCYCNDDLCNDGSTPEPTPTGVTLKCYEGSQGFSIQEIECEGSCMTSRTTLNDATTDYVGCSPLIWGDVCMSAYATTTCYCGSNLCNNGTIPVLPDDPKHLINPSSGDGSGSPFPVRFTTIKCYLGEEGGTITEVDCRGSCVKMEATANGQKATVYDCSLFTSEETCVTTGQLKMCACNRNLCNQAGISGMRTHLPFIYMVICFVVAEAFSSA